MMTAVQAVLDTSTKKMDLPWTWGFSKVESSLLLSPHRRSRASPAGASSALEQKMEFIIAQAQPQM